MSHVVSVASCVLCCPQPGFRVRSHRHECESEYPYTVTRKTSLHAFQWRPFALIRVLYEYGLPVNFTRTSSFCAGRVFIQAI